MDEQIFCGERVPHRKEPLKNSLWLVSPIKAWLPDSGMILNGTCTPSIKERFVTPSQQGPQFTRQLSPERTACTTGLAGFPDNTSGNLPM